MSANPMGEHGETALPVAISWTSRRERRANRRMQDAARACPGGFRNSTAFYRFPPPLASSARRMSVVAKVSMIIRVVYQLAKRCTESALKKKKKKKKKKKRGPLGQGSNRREAQLVGLSPAGDLCDGSLKSLAAVSAVRAMSIVPIRPVVGPASARHRGRGALALLCLAPTSISTILQRLTGRRALRSSC